MFFIIPIGSEEGVRRLPYVTIALIAINLIIWIITSAVLGVQVKELEALETKLFNIEKRYFHIIMDKDPNLLTKFNYDEVREVFATEYIIPPESDDYIEWKNLYAKYKEKRVGFVFNQLGFNPKEFNFLKMISSMFVHENFFHLLFNMIFLWLVGCNIEDDWSWKVFLGLYLVSGIVAILFHSAVYPKSDVPLIGASGAIAGVMGAFMIRHYKTKIRFVYFLWLIFRPYFGTFSIYAGVALPFWFLQQILGASWSVGETGTAYWVHIGGFIFGAGIGASLKFLGLEKKYIAPMVEDSFEKLKVSPKMKEIYRRLDAGDNVGAIPLLLSVLKEEPENFDAPLILARIYFESSHVNDALVMYNIVLDKISKIENAEIILSLYEELKEKRILDKISEKNLYKLAQQLEKLGKNLEAVNVYGLFIKLFTNSGTRPKAIYRTYLLFKDQLKDEAMAQSVLAFLRSAYPNFLIPR